MQELQSIIQREILKCHSANAERFAVEHKIEDPHTLIQRILNSKPNREILRRALGPAKLKIWDEEPHLRYNILRNSETPSVHLPHASGDNFLRLRKDALLRDYRSIPLDIDCLFSQVHIGQRKLLINELLFMNLHSNKCKTVVYIGAAGGSHIPALCELFPSHKFSLWDPAPFSRGLLDYKRRYPRRISVYNELFPPAPTSQSMKELQEVIGEGFLLISDIRRRDEQADAPTNADVDADMKLQFDICKEMKPKVAHLKCRLAYIDPNVKIEEQDIVDETVLPNGIIYYQPWCGHTSTETRLICEAPFSDENTLVLSAKWYESALFYHNSICRNNRYFLQELEPLDIFLGSIYDRCFDCTFERYVIWNYLTSGKRAADYQTFTAIYLMFKRIIGREDERLLR